MMKALFPLAALMVQIPAQPSSEPGGALAAVVEAERAFAKVSETTGMRTAFLANLAEGAIVFRPGPVDGREVHAKVPDVPGMLQWKPVFADVSAAGDFGYTTGPWVFRASEQAEAHYGHYVTVWKKQPDGSWKVVIDAGVPHPKPAESLDRVESPAPSGPGPTDEKPPLESLLEADRDLSASSAGKGFSAALPAQASPALRLYRPGSLPLTDPASIAAALTAGPQALSWRPNGGDAARSGDLGYTYGIARSPEGAENSYMRIWKRGPAGEWKVVLDLSNPMPNSAQ